MGSKSKSTQTVSNPFATQVLQNAQATLPKAYSPVTADQIGKYQNPFNSMVADTTIAGLNKSRQMALNGNSDAAVRASAFGGSRHGVADALTNSEYDQNTASVLANLYSSGFDKAAGMAQQENAAANQYPLLIQQLLGQLAQGTQSNTTGTSSSFNPGGVLQGLGSAASGASALLALSDERAKTDIQLIGQRNGRNWYRFKYKGSDDWHEGVIAQENPDVSVEGPDGLLRVDYGKV